MVGGAECGAEAASPADQPAAAELAATLVESSPHCAQLLVPSALPFLSSALASRRLCEVDRILSPVSPRMPYKLRPDSERSSCHWGQLKLLEAELRILTGFLSKQPLDATPPIASCAGAASAGADSPLVVYAGAAPGHHIPSLVRRFPRCRFELYDPAPFGKALLAFSKSSEAGCRVQLFEEPFTMDVARAIAGRAQLPDQRTRPLIFFSDVRTAESGMSLEEVERCVRSDMDWQRAWALAMRPDMSLFKFRLSWGSGTAHYLRGQLLVQVFAPCTSTESRLVCLLQDLAAEQVEYDQQVYEERLMYHNTIRRASMHDLGLGLDLGAIAAAVPGLDRCFDCCALVETVRAHLAAGRAESDVGADEVLEEIGALIAEIADSGRLLAHAAPVSSTRRPAHRKRRRRKTWDRGSEATCGEPKRSRSV